MSTKRKEVFPISDEVLHRITVHQQNFPEEKMILNEEHAAERLGISPFELQRLVHDGDIVSFSTGPGQPKFFFWYDLEEYLVSVRGLAEIRIAGGIDKYLMKHGLYHEEEEELEEV